MRKSRGHQSWERWTGRVLVGALLIGGPVVLGVAASASPPLCTATSTLSACTINGQATVSAGTLSVSAPSTVKWAGTLNGYDLSQDAPVSYTLTDATGSGSGWNLTASATALTNTNGTTKCSTSAPCRIHKPFTINASAQTAQGTTAPAPTCAQGSTCTLPTYSKVAYPVSVTPTAPAPSTVATAAKTSGMGAITCATDWWLSIPANAHAGTYTNTITLTIASGP